MGMVRGYAALTAGADLVPFEFMRRDVGPRDLEIAISHAGICHSDIQDRKSTRLNSSHT